MSDVSSIANAIRQGQRVSTEELLPLVYDELRRLAHHKMAHEAAGQTLDSTALVHEVFLRLVDVPNAQSWDGRGHFFAAAAEAMRRILVESARNKKRLKRGGGRRKLDLQLVSSVAELPPDEVLDLDEALDALVAEDARKAELVKLRFFGGLSVDEAAECLGISRATADRDWAYARAWLHERFRASEDTTTP